MALQHRPSYRQQRLRAQCRSQPGAGTFHQLGWLCINPSAMTGRGPKTGQDCHAAGLHHAALDQSVLLLVVLLLLLLSFFQGGIFGPCIIQGWTGSRLGSRCATKQVAVVCNRSRQYTVEGPFPPAPAAIAALVLQVHQAALCHGCDTLVAP